VKAATKSDPKRATRDLLKLLNTNFDSEAVYFALAELYKDMWQLEAASVWLEQALLTPNVALDSQKRAWTELADCYLWQGIHLERALQYAKSGGEGISQKRQATVLAHAYLKLGRVREAKQFLDVVQENDHEVLYFKGLIEYRNGSRERANALWKPLLTLRSESLRMHHIKQMVLKFYFEGSPYLKAN
jgi:tetratricopeptide (TPR) repeat protein